MSRSKKSISTESRYYGLKEKVKQLWRFENGLLLIIVFHCDFEKKKVSDFETYFQTLFGIVYLS